MKKDIWFAIFRDMKNIGGRLAGGLSRGCGDGWQATMLAPSSSSRRVGCDRATREAHVARLFDRATETEHLRDIVCKL
jgi:hypothetical protein